MFVSHGLFSSLLYLAGLLIFLVGLVGLYVVAFRQSIVWGLLVFLLPPLMLGFVVCHWRRARTPALCVLGGAALAGVCEAFL
jgi:hypothetical protein